MDIDLLVEDSLENQVKVKQALEVLPDKAVRELGDDDCAIIHRRRRNLWADMTALQLPGL